jgi:hypothetical protein
MNDFVDIQYYDWKVFKYKWFNILNMSLFLIIDFIVRKISRFFRETCIFSHIKQYLTNEYTLNVILFLIKL